MRPLLYSTNITLDGCCDASVIPANDDELQDYSAVSLSRADAFIFGRLTYQMMESAIRPAADLPDPCVQILNKAKKYVVSSILDHVDWNAELLRGNLADAVRQLKGEPGKGLMTGGLMLPLALAELGLIDEYEFVVHPKIAGHGPNLFAGLSKHIDLKPVDRVSFASGAVAMRYEPRKYH
jgi:dihydrofolate reductase